MLLNTYKENQKLFYINFLESTPSGSSLAYRGDLVLIQGEVGDDKGHLMPPKAVVRESVILAGDKIDMLIGGLDKMELLPLLLDAYKADFAADMKSILFVVNLTKPVQVAIEGINLILIPLVQGVPWNEAMEELALEKSDFKGQTPAEKLETMLAELAGYKPKKYAEVSLEEALGMTNNAVRETHGAL
ncbi:hypothetical protein [Oceanobacter mangrovi]|uniref:hypothetical protein n=1 Tax=Oceanobacter mangrovi TaxID=2862510 RepID=UPI001C8E628D|nr:hypothetical protein [Oceanobacter mangrovi]